MSGLLLLPVLPIAVAAAAALGLRGIWVRAATLAAALACLALAVAAAAITERTGKLDLVPDWFGLNSLGALFLLLAAALAVTAALFSTGYVRHLTPDGAAERRYYLNFNLFVASLLLVPLMLEVALAWVAVELTTLLSIFLVGFANTGEALEAAWKYAVLTIMGATVAALGFFLLLWGLAQSGGGPQTFDALVSAAPAMPSALRKLAFALILVGFGTKIGLVPVHTWLPDAHSQAPTPVCALLSGIEVSLILYVVMRLLPVFTAIADFPIGDWLIVVGLLSAGVAAFLLLQVHDLKRLFAYSTVEHMGILLTALGFGAGAAYGTVYHVLTHALAKSLAFYAAGVVVLALGTRDIGAVRGLLRTNPFCGAALLAAGLAIAGAPPFAVFLSEITILRAGLAAEQYWAVGLLAFFIVVAFLGVMRHVNGMVFGEPKSDVRAVLPASAVATVVIAMVPVLVLGISMPGPLAHLIEVAAAEIARTP
ncbi:MAG TPA: proton-conducting transporter membrane subunit [Burkholderiaceae bacterium]|nr:proton-conducting transporter membrane subunit [Burkholderiaceae bacterium]